MKAVNWGVYFAASIVAFGGALSVQPFTVLAGEEAAVEEQAAAVTEPETAEPEPAAEEAAAAVVEDLAQDADVPVEAEAETAPEPEAPSTGIKPKVYIVPLGGEMNLKVLYDHPMDFAGGNYIESIQMEKSDGTFLGLKQFHDKATQAYAEFLVNPELADFTEVVLVAQSSTQGMMKSTVKLELTPEDQLPDEYNPKVMRQKALEKARTAKGGSSPGEKQDKTEESQETKGEGKKKKSFGLF